MTTAADEIYGALRLIGQLAEGETPSPEAAQDALSAFNSMIDSWNIERLAVYCTQDQTFTWPASTATRTLGPTGNFVGNRPILLSDATYYRDPTTGVSFPIQIINQEQYNSIPVKNVTSSNPQFIWVNEDSPNCVMTVYPVPNRDLEWHFVSVKEITQPATLTTEMVFPPGYRRPFRFNLACEIAAEFGVEPQPSVQRIAMTSKRNIKRINNPMDVMSMPYVLTANRFRYNIYRGY